MEIRFENIVLRDMIFSDIEDYVRWFTKETEWGFWDAPWEPLDSDETSERNSWTEYYESIQKQPTDALRWKFEIEYQGRHVGWVSSYLMDEQYEWVDASSVREGQKVYRAVGVDVCEKDVWGNRVGTNALHAFIQYHLDRGADAIYTQTWSGNTRMVKGAARLGFVECCRKKGIREVDGQKYDGLTFLYAGK